MLTLKLSQTSTGRIKIIECNQVDVVPDGDGSFVLTVASERDSVQSVVISNKGGVEFNVAYVENARGSTTQVVHPRAT